MSSLSEKEPHPSEAVEFVTVNTLDNTLSPPSSRPGVHTYTSQTSQASSDPINAKESNGAFNRRLSAENAQHIAMTADSRAATAAEHELGISQGLRLYPKAIGWSMLLSLTIVMEGYDTSLITSFFAFPEFRRSYGTPRADAAGAEQYEISTRWQSGLTNGAIVGSILGLLIAGQLTERVGYKKTMISALVSMSLFVFLSFFAFSIGMLMASQCLCGLSWGVFQTLSTTYAAEVMPTALRSYLTSCVNLAWLIGQLIAVAVIRGLVNNTSEWSYRIPFGLQWAWSVPILIAVLFAPESPWWLIKHEKPELAKKSLLRLSSACRTGLDVDETTTLMQHTNEIEKSLSSGTSYLDCFKNADLRRTEIACMVWITQSLCGSAMTGYATYFYVQAGFPTDRAFELSMGMYGLAICAGVLAWFMMARIGRRTLYLWGGSLCCVFMLACGVAGCFPTTKVQSWALGSLLIVFTAIYDGTLGPVCYILVAEMPSTRLRVKTVVLARIAYNLSSLITNILMPRMLNPTAWDWKGKTGFLWAGTCGVCTVWCFFRLPESKGLTFLELDILFEKRASARKFRDFQVHLAETGYFSLCTTDKVRGPRGWRGIS